MAYVKRESHFSLETRLENAGLRSFGGLDEEPPWKRCSTKVRPKTQIKLNTYICVRQYLIGVNVGTAISSTLEGLVSSSWQLYI